MKIIREMVPTMALEEFAAAHGLDLRVVERGRMGREMGAAPFYAMFVGADVGGDGVLIGLHGNGATEDEAISDYAKQISERLLVVDAYKPSRREIAVPRLTT